LILLLVSVFFLYLGTYCINSSYGEYVWSQSGELRYNFGFSITDIVIWKPKWAYAEIFRDINGKYGPRTDLLGAFYLPLILTDQKYFHKTIRFGPLENTQNGPNTNINEQEGDNWDFPQNFEQADMRAIILSKYFLFGSVVLLTSSVISIAFLRLYFFRKVHKDTEETKES